MWKEDGKLFLYRNLQTYDLSGGAKRRGAPLRMVFSGMLGVAQDVAGIVRNLPWREMGVEFHIFGGGKQLEEIQAWIAANPDCGVFAHGFVPKEEIAARLREMDASIVPLATRIRGAFPSKVFDILPQGLPVLFCGGGEGAKFVASRQVGFVSDPGDYAALRANVERLRDMPAEAFQAMSARCLDVSRSELDFETQMAATVAWLRAR
jgi:glycosyltransferase involved in cell wall biosynthesis